MSRKIPFFDYPALFSDIERDIMPKIHDVLARGAYIMQSDLESFERDLAAYVGVKHAIGVADGTMALLLSLRAISLKPGDEILVPAHTFVASAAAIHHSGGSPVLVDCCSDHLIDPESVRRSVSARTVGIMPVQLNGRTARMDEICAIAEKHGLFIVEDACQALGAKFNQQQAGTFGIAAAMSFYPSKTLGCFGDGGAVLTDNDAVAEKVRLLRDHGRNSNGDVTEWGYNSRLDNLQAAVLGFKLQRYDFAISRRREIAGKYNSRLKHISALLLPPPPENHSSHFDIFQNYEIEADRREDLRAFLADNGVGTIIQWGGKTINQFSGLGMSTRLPYTDQMRERFMLLPMNTALSDEDVEYICDLIVDFYAE